MLKLIRNNKKSVSPVIAVVLLIALTVAAGAIIWTIVLPLLQPKETLTLTSTIQSTYNSAGIVWKGTLEASTTGTINSVKITLANGTEITATTNYTNSISQGANTYTFYFLSKNLSAGSGTITITWTPTSGTSTTYSFDINYS